MYLRNTTFDIMVLYKYQEITYHVIRIFKYICYMSCYMYILTVLCLLKIAINYYFSITQ